jgi:hypothetical protein
MSEARPDEMNRRAFLHGIVPACAMTCAALKGPLGPPCAEAFNPSIKLTRDKTLMQGDA